ncbi:hypothetical protein SAMD00019534_106760 [Acytostelium subglobosum LB1]|uniref:hypothetical protein n=1 Tax=Acytostelium subglobosum LB1 TaxID=1410327 RepID=UPI000644FF89|nr:hypothetical protein SAMD00019534_106760 [Acytostelium subglobosum LB1]GAM27500.1 hypothetical protein SAMD00019534_106760 [Acytostelium subglobosum LB1]|eukprot:XP_012749565.1 hypothetical protein SAMD00019534_106760 [Acytostelium subglobosum LB1]
METTSNTATIVQEFNSLIRKAKECERDNFKVSLDLYRQAYQLLPTSPNLLKKIQSLERKLQKVQDELSREDWLQSTTSSGESSPCYVNEQCDDQQEQQQGEEQEEEYEDASYTTPNIDDFTKIDRTNVEDIKNYIERFKQLGFDQALKLLTIDDFALVRSMCRDAQHSDDVNYGLEVVMFFKVVSSQVDGLLQVLADGQLAWIIPNCFMQEDETKAANHLQLMSAILTQTGPLPPSELAKLDDMFLEELINLGLKYLDYYEEDWLHIFYHTLLAYQTQFTSEGYSPLINKLYTIKKAPELSTELIALLNRDKFEYGLLPQCLLFVADLFNYSTESQVSCFFYTSDIPIVIDIMVRNIHNLDEVDPLRWNYLETLHVILSHDVWISTQYHRDDISTVLGDLLDERYAEKDPRSALISRAILDMINV